MFLFYLFRCIFPNERFELIAFLPLQATKGRAIIAHTRGGRISNPTERGGFHYIYSTHL